MTWLACLYIALCVVAWITATISAVKIFTRIERPPLPLVVDRRAGGGDRRETPCRRKDDK